MLANKFKQSLVALAVVGAFGVGAVTAERAVTIKSAGAAQPVAATVVAAAPQAPQGVLPAQASAALPGRDQMDAKTDFTENDRIDD